MKKTFVSLLLCLTLMFCACTSKEHAALPEYKVLKHGIEIPSDISALAKAYFEAVEYSVSQLLDEKAASFPEFISFEFTADVKLSQSERDALMQSYRNAYGIDITSGIRSSLEDIDRGVSVSFPSFENSYRADADLTIPVKVYYGKNAYTYCSDFDKKGDVYILFYFDDLSFQKYIY